jgi:hypothetical protein
VGAAGNITRSPRLRHRRRRSRASRTPTSPVTRPWRSGDGPPRTRRGAVPPCRMAMRICPAS